MIKREANGHTDLGAYTTIIGKSLGMLTFSVAYYLQNLSEFREDAKKKIGELGLYLAAMVAMEAPVGSLAALLIREGIYYNVFHNISPEVSSSVNSQLVTLFVEVPFFFGKAYALTRLGIDKRELGQKVVSYVARPARYIRNYIHDRKNSSA